MTYGAVCRVLRKRLSVFACALLAGCNSRHAIENDAGSPRLRDGGDSGESSNHSEAGVSEKPPREPWVKVGTVDDADGLAFRLVEAQAGIPVQEGGQGSSHALLAVQVAGFGSRSYFSVQIVNLDGPGQVSLGELPRSRPMACDAERHICEIAPIFVPLGGIAPRSQWDGLHVDVFVTVRNEDGARASGTLRGFLREEETQIETVVDDAGMVSVAHPPSEGGAPDAGGDDGGARQLPPDGGIDGRVMP